MGPPLKTMTAPRPREVAPPPVEPERSYRGSSLGLQGSDPASPSSFRPMGWLVAPTLARRSQARRPSPRRSRDASFSDPLCQSGIGHISIVLLADGPHPFIPKRNNAPPAGTPSPCGTTISGRLSFPDPLTAHRGMV